MDDMRNVPICLMAALGLGGAIVFAPSVHAAAPEIVASIKPVHSLVAALMEGVAEPVLLIKGGGSPHNYALRPSEARALERADIVVWVGEGLETFLKRPLGTLAADARIVTLVEADGLSLLPTRQGGARDLRGHGHGEFDMHFWLDPRNAAAMARTLATVLIEADPENTLTYRANATRLDADLAALEQSLGERLEAFRERPFVVFHDAYQYFERRFDLNAVGSITVGPDVQPGAARLRDLRRTIASTAARCVFSEPQFEPRLVETVVEGMEVGAGVLDPLGVTLPAGPGQYFGLLNAMADSLADCLGAEGAG